jgi:transcriptional regulator with XRE-family HTH domain
MRTTTTTAATTDSVEPRTRPVGELVREHGGPRRVARESGIDHPNLWRYVTGRKNPNFHTRLKLARVFRCRVDEMEFPADGKATDL